MKRTKNKPRRFANTTESKYVAAEQKWRCKNCNCLLSAFYEIDHIIPFSSGGLTELKNLQALCVKCHKRKSMLERLGRCTFCSEKVVHSKFFYVLYVKNLLT